MSDSGFCTHCSHRIESFDGLDCCPACGTRGIPCSDANQVSISINWHELRILIIWAENYQRSHPECGRVVYAIAKRIADQHPDRAKECPLTLAGEFGQLAEKYGEVSVNNPELRQDVAEQTGQELGLIKPPEPPTTFE